MTTRYQVFPVGVLSLQDLWRCLVDIGRYLKTFLAFLNTRHAKSLKMTCLVYGDVKKYISL